MGSRVRTFSAWSPAFGPGGTASSDVHPPLKDWVHPAVDADTEGPLRATHRYRRAGEFAAWSTPPAVTGLHFASRDATVDS